MVRVVRMVRDAGDGGDGGDEIATLGLLLGDGYSIRYPQYFKDIGIS